MELELKSGFQRGASLRTLTGTFPDYQVEILARASENTWWDDGDSTHTVTWENEDPRPLFHVCFWGVSSLSYESEATPLNKAAHDLCNRPIPKGWEVRIPGHNLGGATCRDTVQRGGSLADYICHLVAGRGPALISPAQRREAYEAAKEAAIAEWETAGLDGAAIWAAKLPWARHPEVIFLARKLAGRYMGPSQGHRHFEELNGFKTPLSHPRTQTAEEMAALTCRVAY